MRSPGAVVVVMVAGEPTLARRPFAPRRAPPYGPGMTLSTPGPEAARPGPPRARPAGLPAVETRGLRRTFKASRGSPDVVALDGVDLRIERGEVVGLLGPNGAGNTTAVKILNTLLYPTRKSTRLNSSHGYISY